MKPLTEEETQNMVHTLMPQLIRDGFIEPCDLTEFSLMIPKSILGGIDKVPNMSYIFTS